ncbi:MAG: TolC family protein, partial [Acidobacteriota bacterium]
RSVVDPPADAVIAPLPFGKVVQRDLDTFTKLLAADATLRSVVALVDVWLADRIGEALTALGLELVTIDDDGADAALDGLAARDRPVAVYLAPGADLDGPALADGLRARGIPGFSGRGVDDVDAGWLGALESRATQRLARRVALAATALASGQAVETVPAVGGAPRLTLHRGTLDALELALPWRQRLDARLIGEPPQDDATISLTAARERAVDANLDLRARRLATAASEDDLRQAIAALRPQFGVGLTARTIDEDSAIAGFGAQPERLVSAVGEASWLLFSESARSEVEVEERLLLARQLELEEIRLDLAFEATTALLDVARARALEDIERDNLELTFADLDAARSRREVGAGGRADVARLEARAARDRRALVEAFGERREREIDFNTLLDLPLADAVRAAPELDRAALPLAEVIADPRRLERAIVIVLSQAIDRAPETAAANALIEAADREVLAARRSLYLPDIVGTASYQIRWIEEGAGTEAPELGGPPDAGGFPEQPDETWSLGVGLDLPILTGGARRAEIARAELELDAATVRRREATQRVEARVRRAAVRLEAAYEAADQARRAADAAATAFEVVRDGYRRGAETLTTLLDAQADLVSSRRRAATARTDARGRWAELERAAGTDIQGDALNALETAVQTDSIPSALTLSPEPFAAQEDRL